MRRMRDAATKRRRGRRHQNRRLVSLTLREPASAGAGLPSGEATARLMTTETSRVLGVGEGGGLRPVQMPSVDGAVVGGVVGRRPLVRMHGPVPGRGLEVGYPIYVPQTPTA